MLKIQRLCDSNKIFFRGKFIFADGPFLVNFFKLINNSVTSYEFLIVEDKRGPWYGALRRGITNSLITRRIIYRRRSKLNPLQNLLPTCHPYAISGRLLLYVFFSHSRQTGLKPPPNKNAFYLVR
jgi:hypothetical protein